MIFNQRVLAALVALLLAITTVLVIVQPIFSGQSSFFIFPDAQEQTYAWWQRLSQGWQQGYLLLWDANIYSGRSFVGEMQASVYYPLTWLWLALFSRPGGMPVLALEGLVALHFAIASLSMWALLRHWRLGIVASVAGAICFSMFGPVAERAAAQPNIFFGLCWLPLAVLFASLHVRSRQRRFALAAGAVIAVQVLAGHVQPAFHTALLCGVLCFHHHFRCQPDWPSRLFASARSGISMLLAVLLLALPQWVLTFQYLADAYRWVGAERPLAPGELVPYAIFAHQYIIPPAGFWSLLDPWKVRVDDANTLYLSTAGIVLAAWFAASRRRRMEFPVLSAHAPWMFVMLAFSVAAMVGHLTPLPHVLQWLPLVGQIRELGRYAIIFHFVACVFAAAGFQCLIEHAGSFRPSGRAIASLTGAVTLLIVAYTKTWVSVPAAISAGLTLVMIAVALIPGLPRFSTAAVALATVVTSALLYRPLIIPAVGSNPTAEQAFSSLAVLAQVEAEYGLARVMIDDSAGLRKNFADAHHLQSRLGYSATMYRPYFDFLALDWAPDSEINDLLNMRYVLTREQRDLPMVQSDPQTGLKLYFRPTAYPRVFLASRFRSQSPQRREPDDFKLLHYDDHTMRFHLSLAQPDRVVVSEIAYPGWCAQVDGVPVAIHRAELAELKTPLRSLLVSAGRHEVQFSYRPFAQMLGRCDPPGR